MAEEIEMEANDVWVVVPAYNEADVIQASLSEVLKHFKNIVVIDDYSSDQTAKVALTAGAHVCRHPVNMGQGAALQTGIDYALSKGASAIVTFDADGQHRAEDAEKMVERLQTAKLDLVLGSRFKGAAAIGMPTAKAFFLKCATAYTRFTSGLDITDTHNGLRVMSRSAAEKIRIRQNRMAHASEILNRIAQFNLRYEEFPCVVRYSDYSRRKGQGMLGAIEILFDLYLRRLYK
jgi:glycosyltransferase involved in cell wall biosynthesis